MPIYDLDRRKSVHVKLFADTHAGLRIQSFKLKLSMQEILEELASLVVQGDSYIMRRLERLARLKRQRIARSLTTTDADSILDIIEDETSVPSVVGHNSSTVTASVEQRHHDTAKDSGQKNEV